MTTDKKRSEKAIEKHRLSMFEKFNGRATLLHGTWYTDRGLPFHLARHSALLGNDKEKLTTDFIIRMCGSITHRGKNDKI